MINQEMSPQNKPENIIPPMKMNHGPYTKNELKDRKEARKGETLLANTIELFRAKLEILESRGKIEFGKALELYQMLLADNEKQKDLKRELVDNVENSGNDNREDIVKKMIEENTGIVFNE